MWELSLHNKGVHLAVGLEEVCARELRVDPQVQVQRQQGVDS